MGSCPTAKITAEGATRSIRRAHAGAPKQNHHKKRASTKHILRSTSCKVDGGIPNIVVALTAYFIQRQHSPPHRRQILARARLEVVLALDFRNRINLRLESVEKVGLPSRLGLHFNGTREHRARNLLCCLLENQKGGDQGADAVRERTQPHNRKSIRRTRTNAGVFGGLSPQV